MKNKFTLVTPVFNVHHVQVLAVLTSLIPYPVTVDGGSFLLQPLSHLKIGATVQDSVRMAMSFIQ